MPEENETPKVDETPTPQPDGAKPNGGEPEQTTPEFEVWLAKQPADVQAAYQKHVAGLTSALDKERRANKKRDDEAARKAKEAEDAKLGEVEKRDKKIAALEAQLKEAADRQRLIDARDALLLAVEDAKISFVNQRAQQDAIKFALDEAKYDEDGKIEKPVELLKIVIKDRPHLLKTSPAAPPDTNVAKRGNGNGNVTDAEREKELKMRFHLK